MNGCYCCYSYHDALNAYKSKVGRNIQTVCYEIADMMSTRLRIGIFLQPYNDESIEIIVKWQQLVTNQY